MKPLRGEPPELPDDGEGDARAAKPAEHPLDRALRLAYTHLGRREHSVAELRARLDRSRVAPDVIDEALEIVAEHGYLDDARYARMLVEDRRNVDGWGEQRIRGRLQQAGIERALIDQALGDRGHAGEVQAALDQLERRWRRPPADDRERQRAFGQLIRLGYDSEVVYDAIRAYGHRERAA